MNFINAIKHFHKINKHRYYVCKNCFKAHQYKRGLLHDLSKYSPTEFFESVKYYQGTYSPIDACKKENQWSKAWMHHKGRNRHHWEYWIDNIHDGSNISAILMPYKFAVEMLCDYIGAGQAYQGKNWTPQSEYIWWNKKKASVCRKLAEYLTNADNQLARFKQNAWGPTAKAASENEEVKAHPALAALAAQHAHATQQTQCPGAWFNSLGGLAGSIATNSTEADIRDLLANYEAGLPTLLDD